jgi:CheY-like chemotaxis protein
MERIFDPFFTTKREGDGSGMGLSVVHGIVKSFGGIVTALSEPGHGAVFNVFLPVIERQMTSEAVPEKPLAIGNERILFIDDEPALASLGKQILGSLGYVVTTRTSSKEALELFNARSDAFDLVITDMTMPFMTGEELALEFMQIKPGIPVIICTGFSARIDENKAMKMGIRAFVAKPVLKRELADTIRAVLDSNA